MAMRPASPNLEKEKRETEVSPGTPSRGVVDRASQVRHLLNTVREPTTFIPPVVEHVEHRVVED